MPYLPSHLRGQRKTKAARGTAHHEGAQSIWVRVEAERRALDAWTMQLKTLQLVRESAQA